MSKKLTFSAQIANVIEKSLKEKKDFVPLIFLEAVNSKSNYFIPLILLKDFSTAKHPLRIAIQKVMKMKKDRGDSINEKTNIILAKSLDEASELNDEKINADHIILSALNEKDPAILEIFNELKIKRDNLYDLLKKTCIKMSTPNRKRHNSHTSTEERTSITTTFYCDLTQEARNGKLEKVIGRNEEIDRMISILSKKKKRNPVLVGEAGTGKTAIVEGLAERIANNEMKGNIANCKILSVNLASMVSGTKYRGDFEKRITDFLEQVSKDKNTIIFIDEIHNVIGAGGSSDSSLNAAEIMKPVLARGDIQCIGATTEQEYQKYISSNTALERRFVKINIEEPSLEKTIDILKGIKVNYEEHHNVEITEDALVACVNMSSTISPYRRLPDRAIDLLDETCAVVSSGKIDAKVVDADVIIKSSHRIKPLTSLESIKEIKNHVFGQDEAVNTIIESIQKQTLGLFFDNPCCMIFKGPNSCGKLHTAKKIADLIHPNKPYNSTIINFGSDEIHPEFVNYYLGKESAKQEFCIGDKIKVTPNHIVILNNIQNANEEVLPFISDMVNKKYIMDSNNNRIPCSSLIVIAICNKKEEGKAIGFNSKEETPDCPESLKDIFSKFTIHVDFKKLDDKSLSKVIEVAIKPLINSFSIRGIDISYDHQTITKWLKNKEEKENDISKIIAKVTNQISKSIIENKLYNSKFIVLKVKGKEIYAKVKE